MSFASRRIIIVNKTKNDKRLKNNTIQIIPLISLFLDIYKSWDDFNLLTIIALYGPGFFTLYLIYSVIEMLENCSFELQRLNRCKKTDFLQKDYHSIYEAICNINVTFGLSFFNYVLLSTIMGLLFCYTHISNLIRIYKKQTIIVPACFAPHFWTIAIFIAIINLVRSVHKLQLLHSIQIKRIISVIDCSNEIDLWQIHYENLEISAWDFFKIGNHIFIHVSVIVI